MRQLRADDGQALPLHGRARGWGQGQHRGQGIGRGVERARAEPGQGEFGPGQHLALAAVLLAGSRACLVPGHGVLELAGRVVAARLGQDEAGVVELGGPGEAELTADLEQLVAAFTLVALAGVAGGGDGAGAAVGVAEPGRGQAGEQVQLGRALATGLAAAGQGATAGATGPGPPARNCSPAWASSALCRGRPSQ